jgi:hypothetical protein
MDQEHDAAPEIETPTQWLLVAEKGGEDPTSAATKRLLFVSPLAQSHPSIPPL